MADPHPFEPLAGTWRGQGEGHYPTISPFTYTEELVIEPVPGRPLAHWRSRTRDAPTGEPRHAESGFLRAVGDGAVELVVAHGFGIVEISTGSFDRGRLTVRTGELVGSPTAKRVDEVERDCRFVDDDLSYDVSMAAVGEPLTHHLRATLHR
jgi:hypothetical protein